MNLQALDENLVVVKLIEGGAQVAGRVHSSNGSFLTVEVVDFEWADDYEYEETMVQSASFGRHELTWINWSAIQMVQVYRHHWIKPKVEQTNDSHALDQDLARSFHDWVSNQLPNNSSVVPALRNGDLVIVRLSNGSTPRFRAGEVETQDQFGIRLLLLDLYLPGAGELGSPSATIGDDKAVFIPWTSVEEIALGFARESNSRTLTLQDESEGEELVSIVLLFHDIMSYFVTEDDANQFQPDIRGWLKTMLA